MVKVHPDAREAGKNGGQEIGKSRGGRGTKIRAVTAEDRRLAAFGPLGGNMPDAAEGRAFPEAVGTRESGYKPEVPAKRNRVQPWNYDKEFYKRQKEIERFFRRLKGFRGICAHYDKLARIFSACICIALRCVNTRPISAFISRLPFLEQTSLRQRRDISHDTEDGITGWGTGKRCAGKTKIDHVYKPGNNVRSNFRQFQTAG
jgi:hypothetical protein